MDKKLSGAGAAILGAFLYGGASLMDMEERISHLESAIDVQSPDEPAEELDDIQPNAEPEEQPEEPEKEESAPKE
jgi:hypothetical protein